MTEDVIPAAERNCPAAVAYDLMRDILLDDPRRPAPTSPEFRAYLLDLYAECLLAARGKRSVTKFRMPSVDLAPPSREGKRTEAQA